MQRRNWEGSKNVLRRPMNEPPTLNLEISNCERTLRMPPLSLATDRLS